MDTQRNAEARPRVTLAYWGRRGLSLLFLKLACAARQSTGIETAISFSRQNDRAAELSRLGGPLLPVDTFATPFDVFRLPARASALRRRLNEHVHTFRPQAFLELLPHALSPLAQSVLQARGVRYVTVLHDARVHPGDFRSAAAHWLHRRTARSADLVITLSAEVTRRLLASRLVPPDRVAQLFMPDIDFELTGAPPAPPAAGEPWRLLFLGRILPYKGLPLFLDTCEELRRRGVPIEVGVFGQGFLAAAERRRLRALGAEVVNRWLADAEIRTVLSRFHLLVLSHVEASQSGVAAAAAAAGIPVVATPVGGLIEQVKEGVSGVVAAEVKADALADAALRLLTDAARYRAIQANLLATRSLRSAERFVMESLKLALDAPCRLDFG